MYNSLLLDGVLLADDSVLLTDDGELLLSDDLLPEQADKKIIIKTNKMDITFVLFILIYWKPPDLI
jgi:hypothetical protein